MPGGGSDRGIVNMIRTLAQWNGNTCLLGNITHTTDCKMSHAL